MEFNINFELTRYKREPNAYIRGLPNESESVILLSEMLQADSTLEDRSDKSNLMDNTHGLELYVKTIVDTPIAHALKLRLISVLLDTGAPDSYDYPQISDYYREEFEVSTGMSANEHLDLLLKATNCLIKDLINELDNPDAERCGDLIGLSRILDFISNNVGVCDKYQLVKLMPLYTILNSIDDSMVEYCENNIFVNISGPSKLEKPSVLKQKIQNIANFLYQGQANSVFKLADSLGCNEQSLFWEHLLIDPVGKDINESIEGLNL